MIISADHSSPEFLPRSDCVETAAADSPGRSLEASKVVFMAEVFVSEFLTCGAWPLESAVPESLVREGRAMLEAVLADLRDMPDWKIQLTWDRRLHPPQTCAPWVEAEDGPGTAVSACGRVTLHWADGNTEPALRAAASARAGHILIIAPEFDGLLAQRIDAVEQSGHAIAWNATADAVRLCGDKQKLAVHLQMHGVPTVPTCSVENDPPKEWSEVVIKPIDGAGSQGIQRLSQAQYHSWRQHVAASNTAAQRQWVVQPWVSGRTLSVAAIFGQDGALHDVWPVAEQHLNAANFAYLGGCIPAKGADQSQVEALVSAAAGCIPGLRGYIGLDVIELATGEMLLVEINPRLTTSYVGYRVLSGKSLAPWLEPRQQPLPSPCWNKASVTFAASGEVLPTRETADTPA